MQDLSTSGLFSDSFPFQFLFLFGGELLATERTRVVQLKPLCDALSVEFMTAIQLNGGVHCVLLQANRTLFSLSEVVADLQVFDELLGCRSFLLLIGQKRDETRLEAHLFQRSPQRHAMQGIRIMFLALILALVDFVFVEV